MHIHKPVIFVLNLPFLVLLSVLDVFDNKLEVKHIKNQLLLLCRPQIFKVSHHILSSLVGQLRFHYFHFFLTYLDIVSQTLS